MSLTQVQLNCFLFFSLFLFGVRIHPKFPLCSDFPVWLVVNIKRPARTPWGGAVEKLKNSLFLYRRTVETAHSVVFRVSKHSVIKPKDSHIPFFKNNTLVLPVLFCFVVFVCFRLATSMLKLLLLTSSIHNRSTLLFLFLLLSSHGYYCHQLAAQQQQLNVLDQQAVKTNSLIDSSALLLSLLLANNGSLLGSYSDSKFGPVEDPELEMTTVSIHFSFFYYCCHFILWHIN